MGKLPENSILFSLDVVSLYTNIPTEMGLDWIDNFLKDHRPEGTKPSNRMLVKLLEFVLTCNDFEFNGEFYLQKFGTAIGTKVAPSYANLVVAIFELLYVYKYDKQPLCWHRFIDDIFGIWTLSISELESFVKYLNTRVESLKFTLEYSNTNLSFLDVMIHKDKHGIISTDLFRKPTDARNYLHYSSAHPKSCKKGIPYSQLLRVRRICSTRERFETNALEMAKSFIERGYPQDLVEKAMIRASRQDRKELLQPKPKPETNEKIPGLVFMITTFNPGHNILNDIVRGNAPYLQKNPQYRDLQNMEIKPVYRRPKNLKDLLVRASVSTDIDSDKSKRTNACKNPAKCRYCPRLNKTGHIKSTVSKRDYATKINVSCQSNNLVYAITCRKCDKQYVGQTGRRLMDRFQGHFSTVSRKEKNTLITDHYTSSGHEGWKDMEIYVLDFIYLSGDKDEAKELRLKIEKAWIHRLNSAFPDGLNYLN